MPRIEDQYLDAVIYLYPSEAAARDGEAAGGTGFVASIPSSNDPDLWFLYAVTNSHVIREAHSPIVRVNDQQGRFQILPLDADAWVHHPDGDDLAIVPISLSRNQYRFKAVPREFFLTPEHIEQLDIGPGDDVMFVGRFAIHEGSSRNLPTVRFGTIAMMPHEPITLPGRGLRQECFLVEGHSISGYSGSPVFIRIRYAHGMTTNRKGYDLLRERGGGSFLLGVDCGHIATPGEPVRGVDDKLLREGWHVRQNSGMMAVVPAWKLAALLDAEEVIDMRKRVEKEVEKTRERGQQQS